MGDEVDSGQLQPYLRDGRPFDFSRESGYIAAAGLAYLPQPKTAGLEVQKHFAMPSPTWIDGPKGREHIGFGFQGYMDLWLPDSALVPDMPGGVPYVGDFKTTSDLKWALSKEDLSSDVQAMLYATNAIYETRAKAVDVSWMYFQTRGARKTKRTYLRVVADHVAEQFGQINETALEMKRIREGKPDPLQLPPNPEQCSAYGGCPHQKDCRLSPAQIIEAQAAKLSKALGLDEGLEVMNANGNTTASMLAMLTGKAQTPAPSAGPLIPGAGPPAMPQMPAAPVAAPLIPQAPPAPVIQTLPPGLSPGVVPQFGAPESLPAVTQLPQWMQQPAQPQANPLAPNPSAPLGYGAADEKGNPDPRYAIVGRKPDGSNIYAYEINGQAAPINPPESTLPAAPPTGVTQAPAGAEEPKKRGRPRKNPEQPAQTQAPLLLATTPAPAPQALPGTPTLAPATIDYAALARAVVDEIATRLTKGAA